MKCVDCEGVAEYVLLNGQGLCEDCLNRREAMNVCVSKREKAMSDEKVGGSPWLEVFKALLDLMEAAFPIPDWSEETEVEKWLVGLAPAEAKLICIFANPEKVAKLRSVKVKRAAVLRLAGVVQVMSDGKVQANAEGLPEEVDWDVLIDWIAAIAIALFPQYEKWITIVAEILKQLLSMQGES